MINQNSVRETNKQRKLKKGYQIQNDTINALSYIYIRRAIGILGLSFPVILILGTFLYRNDVLLPSISDYFYTKMKNIFIAIFFIISFFIWFYNSLDKYEKFVAKLSSISLALVCLIPTPVDTNHQIIEGVAYYIHDFDSFIIPSIQIPEYTKYLHYFFASVFLLVCSFLL